MTNLLQQAINCDDSDRAARIIQDALGIESDDVASGAEARPSSGAEPSSSARRGQILTLALKGGPMCFAPSMFVHPLR
jgi:hypothetical protein